MNVETIEDLFVSGLQRAHSIETHLDEELASLEGDADVDALDNLDQTAARENLLELLDEYRDQSAEHRERLEAAFDALGRSPNERSAPALEGIMGEKERFNNVVLNDEIRPIYYAGILEETVQLEVGVYERLVQLAEYLDLPEAVTDAVERNHRESREQLDALEALLGSDDLASLTETVVENAR